MAKPKGKKKAPKPPETAATVIAFKKEVEARKASLAKAKTASTKEGKFDKNSLKYREALKRLKRVQRRLAGEGVRLKKMAKPAEAAAPAAAAPAEPAK